MGYSCLYIKSKLLEFLSDWRMIVGFIFVWGFWCCSSSNKNLKSWCGFHANVQLKCEPQRKNVLYLFVAEFEETSADKQNKDLRCGCRRNKHLRIQNRFGDWLKGRWRKIFPLLFSYEYFPHQPTILGALHCLDVETKCLVRSISVSCHFKRLHCYSPSQIIAPFMRVLFWRFIRNFAKCAKFFPTKFFPTQAEGQRVRSVYCECVSATSRKRNIWKNVWYQKKFAF